jgi:hypothetical protein
MRVQIDGQEYIASVRPWSAKAKPADSYRYGYPHRDEARRARDEVRYLLAKGENIWLDVVVDGQLVELSLRGSDFPGLKALAPREIPLVYGQPMIERGNDQHQRRLNAPIGNCGMRERPENVPKKGRCCEHEPGCLESGCLVSRRRRAWRDKVERGTAS